MNKMSGKSDKIVSQSRPRSANFSMQEQSLLFTCMEPYKNVIECKKTDCVKLSHKKAAWAKVMLAFNANTKCSPRTTENLISCYRNMKTKLKKQRSQAKMQLQDSSKKEILLNALEENGKDWHTIALTLNEPVEVCQESFGAMEKEFKKNETQRKKAVMGTGGGPGPSHLDDDDPLMKIQKFIDPQMDGLYTIYDGDRDIMDQYQKSQPEKDRIKPIEIEYLKEVMITDETNSKGKSLENPIIDNTDRESTRIVVQDVEIHETPTQIDSQNRTDILRKRKAPELETKVQGKKNLNLSFKELTDEKLDLIKLQKQSLLAEMDQKRKIYELELEDRLARNIFNEKMRNKELALMDLKIRNETNP